MFVAGNGSWGVIDEEDFMILPCDSFGDADWANIDEASDGDKMSIALLSLLNNTYNPANAEEEFALWQDVPAVLDTLSRLITELSFSEDSIAQIVEPRLREVSTKLRQGLGL
jgi:hypothetical protein